MLQTYATPAYASETKALWNTPKAGVHSKLHAEDLRRNIPTFQYGIDRITFLLSGFQYIGQWPSLSDYFPMANSENCL